MPGLKKIAIFGATGMTGVCVLEKALSSGLNVRVLLRDTAVLPDGFETKIEIIRGCVTDAEAVKKTVTGTDGVVIALGTRNDLGATTVMSTGVKNVISAMGELGIRPISVCLSSFLFMPEGAVPAMFKEINAEHGRMLEAVENSSLDWIAIFPPHIADEPPTDFLTKEGALPGGRVVSKRDLATILVQSLSQPEYFKKKLGISSKK